jgi:hypothetical protein
MTTELNLVAIEEGTYVLNIAFKDEDGAAISPNSATWTLTDLNGNVINNKLEQIIAPIAAVKDVVLTGDDLALSTSYYGNERMFLVEYIYDSTLGNDLPAKTQAIFDIENLVKVS